MTDNQEEATAQEVDAKFNQILNLIADIQSMSPRTPLIFYGLEGSRFIARSGMDLIQLGMLSEMEALITLPTARAYHSIEEKKKPTKKGSRVLNPHTGLPAE
jgi:hypothetical protein